MSPTLGKVLATLSGIAGFALAIVLPVALWWFFWANPARIQAKTAACPKANETLVVNYFAIPVLQQRLKCVAE